MDKVPSNAGQELVIGGYIPGGQRVDAIIVGFYQEKDLVTASCRPLGARYSGGCDPWRPDCPFLRMDRLMRTRTRRPVLAKGTLGRK